MYLKLKSFEACSTRVILLIKEMMRDALVILMRKDQRGIRHMGIINNASLATCLANWPVLPMISEQALTCVSHVCVMWNVEFGVELVYI